MKIIINLKSEDWAAFQTSIQQNIQKTIRNRFSSFWLNIILWAVITFIFLFIFEKWSNIHWPTALSTATLFILITSLYIFNTYKLQAAYKPNNEGVLLGKHTYIINDAGIKSNGKGYESLHDWSIVKDISRSNEHILIFLDTTFAFIFPIRELENPDEFYNYITKLKEKYNE